MKITKISPVMPRTFLSTLGSFSKETQNNLLLVFEGALKVCFFKYKRKVRYKQGPRGKKKFVDLSNMRLKRSDISSSLALVDFHLTRNKETLVIHELAKNFGKFDEADALGFYEKNLMTQEIKDIFGRQIVFDEDGMIFLYKERTATGRHVTATENYVTSRGKRLCWIRPLLETTQEIYRHVEKGWETFLYVGAFKIPLPWKSDPKEQQVIDHFLVVTRKQAGRPLRFITAYAMNREMDLYRHLEPSQPLREKLI